MMNNNTNYIKKINKRIIYKTLKHKNNNNMIMARLY